MENFDDVCPKDLLRCFEIPVTQPGRYEVRVRIRAKSPIKDVFLFTGRYQFREKLTLAAGEVYIDNFYQQVSAYISKAGEAPVPDRKLSVWMVGDKNGAAEVDIEGTLAEGVLGVFLCGDSTVMDCCVDPPLEFGRQHYGWGQMLPAWLSGKVSVNNQAHGGLTIETFWTEGHFEVVMNSLCAGDYCLIQFSHNDQKIYHLQANEGYREYLKRYVEEVRSHGGIPVLVTSPGRNVWNEDERYLDLLYAYDQVTKQVGKDMEVAVVGLHDYAVKIIQRLGKEAANQYFCLGDYTHTNGYGAHLFAAFVARELVGLEKNKIKVKSNMVPMLPPPNLWTELLKERNMSWKELNDSMVVSIGSLLERIERVNRKGDQDETDS